MFEHQDSEIVNVVKTDGTIKHVYISKGCPYVRLNEDVPRPSISYEDQTAINATISYQELQIVEIVVDPRHVGRNISYVDRAMYTSLGRRYYAHVGKFAFEDVQATVIQLLHTNSKLKDENGFLKRMSSLDRMTTR